MTKFTLDIHGAKGYELPPQREKGPLSDEEQLLWNSGRRRRDLRCSPSGLLLRSTTYIDNSLLSRLGISTDEEKAEPRPRSIYLELPVLAGPEADVTNPDIYVFDSRYGRPRFNSISFAGLGYIGLRNQDGDTNYGEFGLIPMEGTLVLGNVKHDPGSVAHLQLPNSY